MLQKTTAQIKISKLRKRIRIVQGGTSSSKTFTILPLLIQYAIQKPKSEISVVSESIPHLKRGAIRDFLKIMDWTGNFKPANWNKSNFTYNFTNGSYIEFFSADNSDKLRGARRDILFINECNNVDFESYLQLAIRTNKFIYLDFNPVNEFWVHTELMNDHDSCYEILTYLDNEALQPSIIKEIEKARDKAKTSDYWSNWWRVYGLGQTGILQDVIFTDYGIVDRIPEGARLLGYGMDFGFTNDPSTLVALYEHEGKRYFDELVYRKGMVNSDINRLFKDLKIDERDSIFADCSNPLSIAELQNYGYNVYKCDKSGDSVRYGISLLQQERFFVTSNSLNIIKELRAYSWRKNKAADAVNEPVDAFNHCIDAMRYVAIEFLTNQVDFYFQ